MKFQIIIEESPVEKRKRKREQSRFNYQVISKIPEDQVLESTATPTPEKKDDEEDEEGSEERYKCVNILWNDAVISEYVNLMTRNCLFEYTVHITPSTEAPVKSVLYHTVPDFRDAGHAARSDFLRNSWATGGFERSVESI